MSVAIREWREELVEAIEDCRIANLKPGSEIDVSGPGNKRIIGADFSELNTMRVMDKVSEEVREKTFITPRTVGDGVF